MSEGWVLTGELRWIMKYVPYEVSPDGIPVISRLEKSASAKRVQDEAYNQALDDVKKLERWVSDENHYYRIIYIDDIEKLRK